MYRKKYRGVLEGLARRRPGTREELARWLGVALDMQMPRGGCCEGHVTPLDFLAHSFFEEGAFSPDAVVWACRGGGKTTIGAVATLLDLLFKPGIQIRILGGSLEQSEKMYAYLLEMVDRHFRDLLEGAPTQRRLKLVNGSQVQILAQSDRSVRGQRVQKLRCDEVELFDPAVWEAAQLTTKSLDGVEGSGRVRGAVESFSTMHKPGGMMQKILAETGGGKRKTFAWCIWDVIETCAERKCEGCVLWEECGGRAKGASGFVKVEDVITMKSRVSKGTWEHEMLCHPPRFEDAVFGTFRREVHVGRPEGEAVMGGEVRWGGSMYVVEGIIGGVDFGYVGAFVCLVMVMLREVSGPPHLKRRGVWVLDEVVTRELTVAQNAAAMRECEKRNGVAMETVYCDVAGKHANSQTGKGDEKVLREAGFKTRMSYMRIDPGSGGGDGVLDPAVGGARLVIDARCERLVGAFEGYRRLADGRPGKDDVNDHLIDALRYALVGYDGKGEGVVSRHY